MANTRHSKLFKPLPAYQLRIIEEIDNELGVRDEHASLKDIIRREKLYIQKMNTACRISENNEHKEVKRTIVFNKENDCENENNDNNSDGQIKKTFKSFKEFLMSQKSESASDA